MDILIDILLDWIGENSRYEVAGIEPPVVQLMTPQELTREYYTGAPHLTPADGVDERLNALYAAVDGPVGTIYVLAPDYAPQAEAYDDPSENPIWREYLLHELVHHVQWQTGEADTWACQSQGEWDAYLIGGRYLQDARVTDPMPNRNFGARMYSRC